MTLLYLNYNNLKVLKGLKVVKQVWHLSLVWQLFQKSKSESSTCEM